MGALFLLFVVSVLAHRRGSTAMTATTIFEHLIAIYAVVVAPWLAVRKMRQVRADGTAGSKIHLYRRAIFMQFLTVAAVLALCMFGAIPMANLGLCFPRSWPLSLVLGGVIISYFAYTAIRLRPKAENSASRCADVPAYCFRRIRIASCAGSQLSAPDRELPRNCSIADSWFSTSALSCHTTTKSPW